MKKLMICAMLLGLLTTLSVAQRGRASSIGPSTNTRMPGVAPISPLPNTAVSGVTGISGSHHGVAPSTMGSESRPLDVKPSTLSSPDLTTVTPATTHTGADRVVPPDTQGISDLPLTPPSR